VTTKMSKLSETISIEVESAELFDDMIQKIMLFSERCTKKTDHSRHRFQFILIKAMATTVGTRPGMEKCIKSTI
jgi:hypothetical protein